MRQLSISDMMGFVVTIAIGLAALRNADDFWAGLMQLLAACLLGLAALQVIHRRGAARAWWVGFLIFAGGYVALRSTAGAPTRTGPTLATTQLLDYVHARVDPAGGPDYEALVDLRERRKEASKLVDRVEKVVRSTSDPALRAARFKLSAYDAEIAKIAGPVGSPSNRWRALVPGAANYDQFQSVGHSLFALVVGLVGAIISTRIQSRCEPQTAA